MKSTTRSSLTLFTFVALCLLTLYSNSIVSQAAAVPSRRQLSIGGKLFGQNRNLQQKGKRAEQKTFAVKSSCNAATTKVTSSIAKTTSSTAKVTSSTAKTTSSTAKTTSSSTKTTSSTAKTTFTAATAAKTTSSTSAKTTSKATSTLSTAKVTSSATSSSSSSLKMSTTTVTKTVSATVTASTSTSAAVATTSIVLTSNSGSYGEAELTSDLERILKWAYDEDNVTAAEKKEIVAALLSASARYYPEIPTQDICRIMLADIKAESDFTPTMISGGRLDSGSSWGLLQVSPNGGGQELVLFQEHAQIVSHNFTYGMPENTRAGVRGPLLDYDTGKTLDPSTLTTDDLFRPWINIHLAMWIQSNLARSSSQDPYSWAELNDYSWALKINALNVTSARVSNTYQTLLKGGTSLPTTIKTGLGSWVAGPAADGEGSYMQSGDDISTQYLNNIMNAVRFLYGVTDKSKMPKAWLDTYTLNPGLVDYRTY